MFQTYKFKSDHTNRAKLDSIREIGRVYKIYFNRLSAHNISEFYKTLGKVPRYLPQLDIGDVNENFSERYKQTCGKQVKTNFKTWLSNLKNRVKEKITGSDLSEETKKQLYFINRHGLWFKKEVTLRGNPIPTEIIKLARKIYHHCRGRYPKLRNISMDLDIKVARIEKSRNSFDYWIKLSTLNKYHTIYLPIESYWYFESKKGILKKQIQITIKPDKIEFGFVKDVEFQKIKPIKGKIIGLDTGVVIPLTTSTGNQYGQGLYGKLKILDSQITELCRMRRKNGLYKNSDKVNHLYNRARSLIKNEVGRISNRFLTKENPEEIVLENNINISKDLTGFSKRMRRLIKNSCLSKLRDELIEKSEKFSRKSTKINQAYTSQECPACHHVDSENRKSQKIFRCLKCGFTRNADYVASVNIRNRRSIPSINIYTPRKKIRGLLEAFYKPSEVLQV
jgi:putative transposase